jgi:thiosulfate/3-mercaptopyruvate sulfurtransferase
MNAKRIPILPSVVTTIAAAAVAMADPGPAAAPKAGAARPVAARPSAGPAGDPAAVPLLVSPAWLAAHLKDPNLVLLHVGDEEAYKKKHIVGARRIALSEISISKHGDGLMLELPPAEDLRGRLEAIGISSNSPVVVYFGEDWVSPATRVVLTLDAAGLGAHAGLLDGGMPAWIAAGNTVTDAAPPARKGTLAALTIRPIIVDATTVMTSRGKPGFAVVDARDKEFYDGTQTGDSHDHPHKTGHIAGALSVPFTSVWDDHNALLPADELTARFTKAGVKPGDTVIGYCHIGQQATAMLFAARRLGHKVLLYDGSFEDWSLFHPGYPVEKSASAGQAPEAKP